MFLSKLVEGTPYVRFPSMFNERTSVPFFLVLDLLLSHLSGGRRETVIDRDE